MKYEFHVGDYVETVDGRVGYIVEVNTANAKDAYIKYILNNSEIYGNRICDREDSTCGMWLRSMFNRIGQYDFTKPEQPKEIEGLGIEWKDVDIYNKINELVDAVNELRRERT